MSRIDLDAGHVDDRPSNPSTNPHLADIMSRRTLLRGMAATALAAGTPVFSTRDALAQSTSTLGFTEIPHHMAEGHTVAPGYDVQVLIRWGDKVAADAPAFDPTNITGESQAKQFGSNNDFLAFMPLPLGSNSSDSGLIFSNHENVHQQLIWPGIVEDKVKPELTLEAVLTLKKS